MYFKVSSAICFKLDQSKILSSGNGLSRKKKKDGTGTLYFELAQRFVETIPCFYDPKKLLLDKKCDNKKPLSWQIKIFYVYLSFKTFVSISLTLGHEIPN